MGNTPRWRHEHHMLGIMVELDTGPDDHHPLLGKFLRFKIQTMDNDSLLSCFTSLHSISTDIQSIYIYIQIGYLNRMLDFNNAFLC